MNIIETYRKWCTDCAIPFEEVKSVSPYDTSTLFCPAGMQQYKAAFKNSELVKTVANVQACIRMNDFDEIGDATHLLHFNMIGFFSFNEHTVQSTIIFFMVFMERLGLKITHVTIHPDKMEEWKDYYNMYDVEVRPDTECMWTDGDIGGYCTEFYIDEVEVGNIVNPLGTCIDVGFGLERLEMFVNGRENPSAAVAIKETILAILQSGYKVGPKLQGYVLKRLVRQLYKLNATWDNSVFLDEVARQEKLVKLYDRLKSKHQFMPAEWWYDTHGIVLADMQD